MKKMMKFFTIALSVMTLGLQINHVGAEELPDLKGRVIVAVTENAYPPLNFLDPKTGQGIGWEYDAFNEIANRLNAKVQWELSSWDVMIEAVRNGQYDVGMDGITINAEREEQIDFTESYMTSEMFMLVRDDEDRFATASDFAAKEDALVGAQPGTTGFYTAVYSILDGDEANSRITLMETFGATIQALRTGDVDMVLTDATAGQGYIDAYPGLFKMVGGAIGSEDFGFILTPNSDLREPINAAIKQMKMDGSFEELNKKWFFDYKIGQ
ncbi:transporter substrate-binding domain-containing protein [Curvivirga sp.]|uniref:transporter substrate-binding domain-containing protein n=1 Tax=Curvivirga sp. TaxID=2856848 RepID=UPI003B5C44DF